MVETKKSEGPIIKVRGLNKHFGSNHIIKGVNLDVGPGEVVVIMGPSGGGKSTFLRCLNLLDEPSAGTIEICGIRLDAKESKRQWENNARKIRRQAAMVFQDFNLFPHMTVLDNITKGAIMVKGVSKEQVIHKAEALLGRKGLLARRDDYPNQLAVGEQQQVAIARSLCMEPQVMLFDDPTSALDPILVRELVATMVQLVKEGIAMVVVTNEPYLTRNVADLVILMDDGMWLEMAPPQEIFTRPKKERTRQFMEHILLKEVSVDP